MIFAVGVGLSTAPATRPLVISVVTAGAAAGGAVFGQALWAWLAARRRGPSWIGAVVAAVLTVPLANLTAWAFVNVAAAVDGAFLIGSKSASAVLFELGQVGLLMGMLTTASTIRFAPVSLPLAILASLATTFWYRRRLQQPDLPSYASRAEAGP